MKISNKTFEEIFNESNTDLNAPVNEPVEEPVKESDDDAYVASYDDDYDQYKEYEKQEKYIEEIVNNGKEVTMKLKEGTGNFSIPDDGISLVAYIVEHNEEDGANDDSYFDYEGAMNNANKLIDKLSDSTRILYNVEVASGYYYGIQIAVTNQGNNIFALDESIDFSYQGILELDDDGIIDIDPELRKKLDNEVEDGNFPTFEEADTAFEKIMGVSMDYFIEEETEKKEKEAKAEIEAMLTKLVDGYGWARLRIRARFSNGETIYSKVKESHIKESDDDAYVASYDDDYDQYKEYEKQENILRK